MHSTEFWAIVERNHTLQNPSSPEKLMLLAQYCGVRDGMRILDIGCGKGWLLRTWSEHWSISGIGLDINPWFINEARAQAPVDPLGGRLTFIEGPALDFIPDQASFDIVLCIGASAALGSFDQAIPWMRYALRPGGVLALGEPFLQGSALTPELRAIWGETPVATRDLRGTVAAIEEAGLDLSGIITATPDDWDRYYSPQWQAALEWAENNPEHPERQELLSRISAAQDRYLRWERQHLGWGIFVAR